jgi:hypothetical protein
MVGPHAQCIEGGAHRLMRSAQNVDCIDLDRIDNADGPRNRVVSDQVVVNFLAPFRQELLRIIQPAMTKLLGEHHRCRYDRTGQRAAPRLINACNRGDAERAQSAFMPEATATIHERINDLMN